MSDANQNGLFASSELSPPIPDNAPTVVPSSNHPPIPDNAPTVTMTSDRPPVPNNTPKITPASPPSSTVIVKKNGSFKLDTFKPTGLTRPPEGDEALRLLAREIYRRAQYQLVPIDIRREWEKPDSGISARPIILDRYSPDELSAMTPQAIMDGYVEMVQRKKGVQRANELRVALHEAAAEATGRKIAPPAQDQSSTQQTPAASSNTPENNPAQSAKPVENPAQEQPERQTKPFSLSQKPTINPLPQSAPAKPDPQEKPVVTPVTSQQESEAIAQARERQERLRQNALKAGEISAAIPSQPVVEISHFGPKSNAMRAQPLPPTGQAATAFAEKPEPAVSPKTARPNDKTPIPGRMAQANHRPAQAIPAGSGTSVHRTALRKAYVPHPASVDAVVPKLPAEPRKAYVPKKADPTELPTQKSDLTHEVVVGGMGQRIVRVTEGDKP